MSRIGRPSCATRNMVSRDRRLSASRIVIPNSARVFRAASAVRNLTPPASVSTPPYFSAAAMTVSGNFMVALAWLHSQGRNGNGRLSLYKLNGERRGNWMAARNGFRQIAVVALASYWLDTKRDRNLDNLLSISQLAERLPLQSAPGQRCISAPFSKPGNVRVFGQPPATDFPDSPPAAVTTGRPFIRSRASPRVR